jgi:hypothetical protein
LELATSSMLSQVVRPLRERGIQVMDVPRFDSTLNDALP